MKFFIANIFLICCLFFSTTSYSQLSHCCKGKKVKIKKGKKRKGALVGVKGHDDKKALKNKMKELKNAAKERKQAKKIAAKEEEIIAEEKKTAVKDERESAIEFIDSLGVD